MRSDDPELARALLRLSRAAAAAIRAVYAEPFEARAKDDKSPVTDADEAAEKIITAGLKSLTPDFTIVAEEAMAAGDKPRLNGRPFWLVDPLDGTREFIKRNGEFTVNIALIENGRATLGIVLLPVSGAAYLGTPQGARLFADDADNQGRAISARPMPADGADVLVSRSHPDPAMEAWLKSQRIRREITAGSSLKFCRIAEGAADLYPRFARISEWDTAAGQAVLEAAGGSVRDFEGRALLYGKPDFKNPPFIARGLD